MSRLLFDPKRPDPQADADPPVLTVSELNRRVRECLTSRWPDLWVEGEISNFKAHGSGHWYFRLKDETSQIDAAMFRGSNRRCRFVPEDGLHVLVRGGLELYLPRGAYQIVVREMLPKGQGALQLAFQQLRDRLDREGLFAPERKRPLPMLPRRVGVVTSRDGAALRDILRVLRRRYANIEVAIAPCRVQGEGAADEIARSLELTDREGGCDVIIVGRGGGSIEDLWAFNEEVVARAVAACATPVISAVGHETDTTISDLVADLRAPTPSAAAEQVVESRRNLAERVAVLRHRISRSMVAVLGRAGHRREAVAAEKVFSSFQGRLRTLSQQVDELDRRGRLRVLALLRGKRSHLELIARRLSPQGMRERLGRRASRWREAAARLAASARRAVERHRRRWEAGDGKLGALSPLAVLDRGYALVRREGRVVARAADLEPGARIEVMLRKGRLSAEVLELLPEERPGTPSAGGAEGLEDEAGEKT